jgi:hypothetical protein
VVRGLQSMQLTPVSSVSSSSSTSSSGVVPPIRRHPCRVLLVAECNVAVDVFADAALSALASLGSEATGSLVRVGQLSGNASLVLEKSSVVAKAKLHPRAAELARLYKNFNDGKVNAMKQKRLTSLWTQIREVDQAIEKVAK